MFTKSNQDRKDVKQPKTLFNDYFTHVQIAKVIFKLKNDKRQVRNYIANDVYLPRSIQGAVSFNQTANNPLQLFSNFISFFRNWVFPVILATLLCLVLFTYKDVPFNKFLFTLVSLGFFSYLLLSGFIFFIKKYKYGKYTTAMHRFWRRSFSIFWALEGYLFVVFLYLTVYSNQEPFFMYDNAQFFKDFVYPWRLFINESVLFLVIVLLLNSSMIRVKDRASTKTYVTLSAVTVAMVYLAWVEFYQLFYTLSYYNSLGWVFDADSSTWVMELENKRSRVLLHFITICLVAKFWHFVFILGFWVFSVTRWVQSGKVCLPLIGANVQNFVILYLLNWILMYPWLKYAFRRFLYKNYTWYYSNFRFVGLRIFFSDMANYATYMIV